MARIFAGLKLRLMAGALRGADSGWRIAGLALAVLAALWVIPLAFSALAAEHGRPLAGALGVVVFTAACAGWLVLPLLMFGTDETLDPARLALLPLRPAVLARGLLAAALTGIGPVVTFFVLLGVVAAVARGPGAALIGLAAVVVDLALCVTGSRALATAFSGLLRSRRGRDLGVLASGLLSLGVIIANIVFQNALLRGGLGRATRSVAAAARWSPPGLAAHAISDAARGDYPAALAELAVAAAVAGLLLVAWMAALRQALVSPDSSTQPARRALSGRVRAAGHGQVAASAEGVAGLARLRPGPASRTLTVAAKELRYAWRDPRRKASLLVLAMAVIVTLSVSQFGPVGGPPGSGPLLLAAAGVYGGTIAGIQSANQFGLDGGALWLNLAATVRPRDLRADLAGKNLASAVIAVPVFALLYLLLGLASGEGGPAAAAFGLACCALGVTLGLASLASVLLPYALPERRTSAFGGGGTGRGCLGVLSSVAILVLTLVAMAPLLVLTIGLHPGPWLLAVGPAYGAALAWAGRLAAAAIGFGRMPELLAEVSRPV